MTCRCATAEGSSMEQNQKLRRSTSLGSRSLGQELLSVPEPMPPSESAMFRFGKRNGTPDHSHSPAARRALTGKKVGRISKGGSNEASGAQPDAPVCRQTTVSVSSQAAKKGSHAPLKIDGRCRRAGNS